MYDDPGNIIQDQTNTIYWNLNIGKKYFNVYIKVMIKHCAPIINDGAIQVIVEAPVINLSTAYMIKDEDQTQARDDTIKEMAPKYITGFRPHLHDNGFFVMIYMYIYAMCILFCKDCVKLGTIIVFRLYLNVKNTRVVLKNSIKISKSFHL